MAVSASGVSASRSDEIFARAIRTDLCERVIFWAFIAALAWVPFWFGSNGLLPWGINAVVFSGLLIAYELSLLVRGRTHPVSVGKIGWAASLFVVVVIWIALQNATFLPRALQNPIWEMAKGILRQPVEPAISVNRDLTELALMRLLTAASVFWLSLQLCRERTRAILLFKALILICVAYTLYGFIAVLVTPGRILWFVRDDTQGILTATFFNRNSYATYAGMGLVISVAVTLERYQQEAARSGVPFKYKLASMLETTGRTGAAMLAGIFILSVGVLGTGSRGGFISTLFALSVFAILSGKSRSRGKEQRLTILVAGLVLLAVFIGFGDELVGHINDSGISDQSRLKVWHVVLASIEAAPLLGFGYGTFADVFPMFRTDMIAPFTDRWVMAHDTYLEVLQGLGLVFGAMLIASVASILFICLRGATTRRRDAVIPRTAISVGMLVGLHSLVDFSLQIQAITLTFMAILGAGTAQAFSSQLSTADAESAGAGAGPVRPGKQE